MYLFADSENASREWLDKLEVALKERDKAKAQVSMILVFANYQLDADSLVVRSLLGMCLKGFLTYRTALRI